MSTMRFTLHRKDGSTTAVDLEYGNIFAIGYAGRSIEKTMEHIRELERNLGVPAPKKIPTIFQCSNNTLTQEEAIHFVSEKTCGEVEYVIVLKEDHVFIGLGSDHTDRELESASVPKAKQVCAKPICGGLWEYEDMKGHWDDIRLRSYQTVDGAEILYQDGKLGDILPVETILHELKSRVGDIGNAVIFSGTVPLKDGFKYGSCFRYEMVDEKLGRTLSAKYDVLVISEEER